MLQQYEWRKFVFQFLVKNINQNKTYGNSKIAIWQLGD